MQQLQCIASSCLMKANVACRASSCCQLLYKDLLSFIYMPGQWGGSFPK